MIMEYICFDWALSPYFSDFSFFLYSRLKFAVRISLAPCRLVQGIPQRGRQKELGIHHA